MVSESPLRYTDCTGLQLELLVYYNLEFTSLSMNKVSLDYLNAYESVCIVRSNFILFDTKLIKLLM